ncbi:hypothetical protein BC938DRAFT_481990 [Jimgerdemannia flammicorona]|uniref:Uncharacterized protein n=1 Tax=Jimgerdemannia flammicorona TaxID=994334 RepID=A0A433QF10_9FUNG|nr:hypothetical protein BC938DRAFT_481990 [Jimgerdemannia flammicorona]
MHSRRSPRPWNHACLTGHYLLSLAPSIGRLVKSEQKKIAPLAFLTIPPFPPTTIPPYSTDKRRGHSPSPTPITTSSNPYPTASSQRRHSLPDASNPTVQGGAPLSPPLSPTYSATETDPPSLPSSPSKHHGHRRMSNGHANHHHHHTPTPEDDSKTRRHFFSSRAYPGSSRLSKLRKMMRAWWLDSTNSHLLPSGGSGGDKKGNGVAFGGPAGYHYPRLLRPRWVRVVITAYVIFSAVLSAIHLFQWAFRSPRHRQLTRTYDSDEEYSLIMDMTPAHKFNKLFAKSLPETLENVQPYWLRAETKPLSDDVSLITYVTEDQLDEFVTLAERWQDVGRSGKEDDGIRLRFDGVFGTRWKVRREGATWRDKKRGDSANPFFMVMCKYNVKVVIGVFCAVVPGREKFSVN